MILLLLLFDDEDFSDPPLLPTEADDWRQLSILPNGPSEVLKDACVLELLRVIIRRADLHDWCLILLFDVC